MASVLRLSPDVDRGQIKQQLYPLGAIEELCEELVRAIYRRVNILSLDYSTDNGNGTTSPIGYCKAHLAPNLDLKFSTGKLIGDGKGVFYHLHSLDSTDFHLFNCSFAGQVLVDSDGKVILRDMSLPYSLEIRPLNLKIEFDTERGGRFVELPMEIPKDYQDCFLPSCVKTRILRFSNLKQECFGILYCREHQEECVNDVSTDTMYLSVASAYAPIDNGCIDAHIRARGWDILPEEVRREMTVSWADVQNMATSWLKENLIGPLLEI